MIETSYLSVSALSSPDSGKDSQQQDSRRPYPGIPAEELVGFAVLSDTPRSGPSEDWLEWFSETHAPPNAEITMTNVLWVDFAIAASPRIVSGMTSTSTGDESKEQQDENDATEVIESIVRTVFSTLPEVDYLVMNLTGDMDTGHGDGKGRSGGAIIAPKYLLTAFEVLTRHADAPPNNLDEVYGKPLLLLCDRMAFLPTLAVRKSGIKPLPTDLEAPCGIVQAAFSPIIALSFLLGKRVEDFLKLFYSWHRILTHMAERFPP